jgi:hypothetical protein
MCHHGFSYAAGRFMKCHGFGPHQWIMESIIPILLTSTWKRLINTLNLRMRSMWVTICWFYGIRFTNRKRKYTWFQTYTHVRTEDGDLPQSYPTLLDRVLMTPFSQYSSGSLIITRLISSKKLREQQLTV